MTDSILVSILLTTFGAALAFLAAWFWHRKNAAIAEATRLSVEQRELNNRVVDLELQLSAVKQTVQPISAAFQAILIKELTHFHTPRLDALLQKIGPPNTMTPDELEEMRALLQERAESLDGSIPQTERDAAAMLPLVIKRVLVEAMADEPVKIDVVTTPAKLAKNVKP